MRLTATMRARLAPDNPRGAGPRRLSQAMRPHSCAPLSPSNTKPCTCRGVARGGAHEEAVAIYEELQAMTEAHRGADAQTAAALATLSEVRSRRIGLYGNPEARCVICADCQGSIQESRLNAG